MTLNTENPVIEKLQGVRFADVEPHPFVIKEDQTSVTDIIGGHYSSAEKHMFNGLYFVAADQCHLMARVRVPGGQLSSNQLREIGLIARDLTTGYIQITTRANFQIRHLTGRNAYETAQRLQAVGLHKIGDGANNVRNITASPLAGVAVGEKVDVSPLIQEWAWRVTHDPDLKGLPRKFNVSFDDGGPVRLIEDTNDITVYAAGERGCDRFRIILGGDMAGDLGVEVDRIELISVLTTIARVYIVNKDRSRRKKTRVKGVLDNWNLSSFLNEIEFILGRELTKVNTTKEGVQQAPPPRVGIIPHPQPGLNNLGVSLHMGSVTSEQLLTIAQVADRFGSGELRLTVWQNIVIPNLVSESVSIACSMLNEAGLKTIQSNLRSGIIACTGSNHCQFSSTDTKGHAIELADYLESKVELETPLNIHLTGCSNSCAQHYIGDIGLLATKIKVGDSTLPAYHVFVGGSFGKRHSLGRQLYRALPMEKLKLRLETMLKFYLAMKRKSESFQEFTARHETDRLILMFNVPRSLSS